jgi:hypothetical protein
MYRLSLGDCNTVVVKLLQLLQEVMMFASAPFVKGTVTDLEDKQLELNMNA